MTGGGSTMMMERKHLSAVANDVVQRCALKIGTSMERLEEEFAAEWRAESSGYSRKFVEVCSSKALSKMCERVGENFTDGSFSRLTYDMMLAWEMPSSSDEEAAMECVGKEKEEKKRLVKVPQENDEVPLFYSDLVPLLVDHEPDVGEDAFVWLASLFPLVADVVNGRFTFETLTAPTASRLHFPAYDKFLKEIDQCIKHLQTQETPKGVELAEDEFILHVEGTLSSQRVVWHIGSSSWPGRLTLTNYALYFEASGVINYEDAVKIDLSKDKEGTVKPAATGPWGAPLFDKAMAYESSELSEGFILEFPEITSSTRRDHWLALTKEIMLMHRFLSKFMGEHPTQVWEVHSRTILSIIRLHAAREMLRISPPLPMKFLIFSQFDELPKGDIVLEELADSLKKDGVRQPCSASSILKTVNILGSLDSASIVKEEIKDYEGTSSGSPEGDYSLLNTAINQVREEAEEVEIAKATVEGLKDEGIGDSAMVLMELLKPLKGAIPRLQETLTWERPLTTLAVLCSTILVLYKEWVNKAVAAFSLWLVVKMLQARKRRSQHWQDEIVVCTASVQSTMESIVSAQKGLQTVHAVVQAANIALLKLWSIFVSRAPKHADAAMVALSVSAMVLAVIPLKYILMGVTVYSFAMNSRMRKHIESDRGNRRLKEWWDSIPVVPVRVADKAKNCPKK
ncbi:uncharacterized protein LOC116202602 [Punica granatum]|uniref:Uncharacterized protein LOC116202602 n=1 Tax=Punica granatum TaxID=22663 RepID=A0A6P8D6F0_PUNGR|nr:uncharacterized protein LOC116202602 [Punica granatum]